MHWTHISDKLPAVHTVGYMRLALMQACRWRSRVKLPYGSITVDDEAWQHF